MNIQLIFHYPDKLESINECSSHNSKLQITTEEIFGQLNHPILIHHDILSSKCSRA